MLQIGNRCKHCPFSFLHSASLLPSHLIRLHVLSHTGEREGLLLQDIKPRFHQPRIHGVDGPEEDEVCCDQIAIFSLQFNM